MYVKVQEAILQVQLNCAGDSIKAIKQFFKNEGRSGAESLKEASVKARAYLARSTPPRDGDSNDQEVFGAFLDVLDGECEGGAPLVPTSSVCEKVIGLGCTLS